MSSRTVIVGLTIGALALAGCGSTRIIVESAPTTRAPAPTTTTTLDLPPVSADASANYLLELADSPDLAAAAASDPTDMVKAGQVICYGLASGLSVSEVMTRVLAAGSNTGFTPDMGGQVVGLAVGNFCPDYAAAVEANAQS